MAFRTRKFDTDRRRLEARGFEIAMNGEVGGERGTFAYFDMEFHPGTVMEWSDISGPKGRLFDLIRAASANWDGRDPVRPFPDLGTV